MLFLKMSMTINQIIDLWRGLSPRLAKASPDQDLPEDEHTNEKKSDEDSRTKQLTPLKVIRKRVIFKKENSNAY